MATKKLSDAQLKDLLARVKFFTRKTGAISFTVATKDDAGRTHVLRWAVVDPSFKFPRNIDWSTEQDFRTKSPSEKASSKVRSKKAGVLGQSASQRDSFVEAAAAFPNAAKKFAVLLDRNYATFSVRKHGSTIIGLDVLMKGQRPSFPGLERDLTAREVGKGSNGYSMFRYRISAPKASSKAKNTRSAQVDEVIRLFGKNINADGKPNASREELRFLGPRAVTFLMAKMGRGDVGVQIGKTGLKLTVMRDFGTVVPAIPGMKHGRTIVSGRGAKGRYTHTYTKPGVKFGSF